MTQSDANPVKNLKKLIKDWQRIKDEMQDAECCGETFEFLGEQSSESSTAQHAVWRCCEEIVTLCHEINDNLNMAYEHPLPDSKRVSGIDREVRTPTRDPKPCITCNVPAQNRGACCLDETTCSDIDRWERRYSVKQWVIHDILVWARRHHWPTIGGHRVIGWEKLKKYIESLKNN